MDLFMAIFGDN